MPARSTSASAMAPKRARRAVVRRRARQPAGTATRPRLSRPQGRSQGAPPASRGRSGESERLPAPVSGVLRRLGRAVAAGDMPGVSACFAYPSILLTGADTHEFRDPLQVETVFRESLRANGQAGIAALTPRFEHVADLGHGIFACDVRWQETGERAHFIVQESAVGTALVRFAVASGA